MQKYSCFLFRIEAILQYCRIASLFGGHYYLPLAATNPTRMIARLKQDSIWCFFGNSYMLDWYERNGHMILEVAVLQVKSGMSDEFERNFKKASAIISSMKGYICHELQKCIEEESKYILLVRWETLKDHTEGFRGSAEYLEWKSLLHHFYDPFPTVEHYTNVDLS